MQPTSAIHPQRGPAPRVVEYALAAMIFVGSLMMWVALPICCVWLASQAADDASSFLFLVLLFTPLAMIAFGLLLGALNGAYLRATGAHPAQSRSAWLKSLSGERQARRPRAVLDASMTVSVIVALIVFLVWYFFFAESYMPAPIAP